MKILRRFKKSKKYLVSAQHPGVNGARTKVITVEARDRSEAREVFKRVYAPIAEDFYNFNIDKLD